VLVPPAAIAFEPAAPPSTRRPTLPVLLASLASLGMVVVAMAIGVMIARARPAKPGTIAAPASAPADVAPFDRAAAVRALAIDVSSCKRPGAPTGPGHARVTFQPSGAASAVDVDAPYAGTAAGGCVAQKYRAASIPPFSGGALGVGKSFSID
jgi:hypothetical protein